MLLDLKFYMYVLLIVVCPFVLFLLTIVLSVLLRYTNSDYPFGILKLFLQNIGPTNVLLLTSPSVISSNHALCNVNVTQFVKLNRVKTGTI